MSQSGVFMLVFVDTPWDAGPGSTLHHFSIKGTNLSSSSLYALCCKELLQYAFAFWHCSLESESCLLGSFKTDTVATLRRILGVIFKYKYSMPNGVIDRSDERALTFLGIIYRTVKLNQPIQMVLPAFPFRSPNNEVKVLGKAPDKAEDMALSHSMACALPLNKFTVQVLSLILFQMDWYTTVSCISDRNELNRGLTVADPLWVLDPVFWNYG